MVDCTPFGYPFVVMDHMVGHESEAGYFDHAGNLIRTLYQTQGTDQLYLSTAPGVYLASGPFRYSSHVELLGFDPLLVEARLTGTMWNVRLPGQSATSLRRSGQEVHIIEGEPPGNLIATTKWVGMEAFDEQALCEVLAE